MDSKRGQVLVVDDDAVIRYSLQRALEQAGFAVEEASSAAEALERLAREPLPGVVMTDIRMPGMSGLELLREIKLRRPEVEVIMMTAFADSGVAEESLQLGASAVLLKPFANIFVAVDTVKKSMARAQLGRGKLPGSDADLEGALRQSGLVSEEHLQEAWRQSEVEGRSLREILAERGMFSEEELDWALSAYLEVPYVRLKAKMLDVDLISSFPSWLAREYRCLPLFRSGEELHLVAVFPLRPGAGEVISRELKVRPVFSLGHKGEVEALIQRYYGGPSAGRQEELINQLTREETADRAALLRELLEGMEFVEPVALELMLAGEGEVAIEIKGRLRPRRK